MADSDEYIELLEEARDVLRELLTHAEPGTGLDVHRTYNQIKAALARETGEASGGSEADSRLRRQAWLVMPRGDRTRLLLQELGDRRLTINELTDRVSEARADIDVYEGDIRALVYRLCREGELDRAGERRCRGDHKGSIRYRYFRNTTLDGPIADLERAFHEPIEEAN